MSRKYNSYISLVKNFFNCVLYLEEREVVAWRKGSYVKVL